MSPIEIAGLVLNGIGSLAPLAASLLGATREEAAEIIAKMKAEVGSMNDLLRDGGSMDREFAEHDAKLDDAIKAVEETKP